MQEQKTQWLHTKQRHAVPVAILSLAKQTMHMCMAHKTLSKYVEMFTPIVEIGPENEFKRLAKLAHP